MSEPRPVARLTQSYGPWTAEWSLFPDHLAIETRTPFGHTYVPLDLARLDGFSFESGPLPGLVVAAAASLAAATLVALGALVGAAGLGAVFLTSALAAFLVTTCRLTRHERVVVHTLGARRFVLYAGLSPAPERDRFLEQLERVRGGAALAGPAPGPGAEDEAEEAGPDLDEAADTEVGGGSRPSIDRRWIN